MALYIKNIDYPENQFQETELMTQTVQNADSWLTEFMHTHYTPEILLNDDKMLTQMFDVDTTDLAERQIPY